MSNGKFLLLPATSRGPIILVRSLFEMDRPFSITSLSPPLLSLPFDCMMCRQLSDSHCSSHLTDVVGFEAHRPLAMLSIHGVMEAGCAGEVTEAEPSYD